ncbi:MAG: 4a-hydroxytetrahydrobiopterin dehydratase [Bacteroidia bacterium]|nr:4a-hydroxytetrahydrobiopterin dehydratase [Bacteroidia bacterium]
MNWRKVELENDKSYLEKEFVFKDFVSAFSFMTRIAFLAEKHNHHPEWKNVYNKVMIKLSTHDAGDKVSEKDLKLANLIDEVFIIHQ